LRPDTPITTSLLLRTSTDGVTFTTQETLPSATFTPGAWTYFNLDPSITSQYLQIRYVTGGTWTLNQLQFGLSQGQDILIGPLNIDDYYNLPDKQFQGNQCISGYQQRNVDVPVLKLWPTPNTSAFYNGCISMLTRRYIQDPGAFTNDLEVPQRWLEASIWRLASRMIDELPDEQYQAAGGTPDAQKKMALITRCETQAAKSEALAWAERLAASAPLAVRGTKAAVNAQLKRALLESFDLSMALELPLFLSADHEEALAALREKRLPRFEGR
jgi:hypothetical protein